MPVECVPILNHYHVLQCDIYFKDGVLPVVCDWLSLFCLFSVPAKYDQSEKEEYQISHASSCIWSCEGITERINEEASS